MTICFGVPEGFRISGVAAYHGKLALVAFGVRATQEGGAVEGLVLEAHGPAGTENDKTV